MIQDNDDITNRRTRRYIYVVEASQMFFNSIEQYGHRIELFLDIFFQAIFNSTKSTIWDTNLCLFNIETSLFQMSRAMEGHVSSSTQKDLISTDMISDY